MANIIKIKRGLSKDLSKANLQEGEIAFTTDTKKLYVSNTDEPINNDTTYSLSKSGSTITLTGSDGSTSTVSDSNTTYNEATSSAKGLMSANDKKSLDAIVTAYDMGSMAGKTKAQLQAYLDTWLTTYGNIPGAVAYFTAAGDWATVWNSTDTTLTISAGGRYVVSVIGTYGSKDYTHLRFATYHDEYVFYVAKSGGVWRDAHQVAYKDDLPSNATTSVNGLMSSTDKSKLDGIATGATKNTASSTTPKANGTAAVGSESNYARGDHIHPAQTTISGNAGTATKFASAQSVALTGDVTGSASSQAGWSVATTLANSGVTAGSYGPTANVTGTNGTTINVPQITVDAKGRVTSVVNRVYTSKDTDTNTTYSAATTSADGLMTSAMVTKLNGIADGANKYSLPTASSTLGGVKTTSTVTSTSGLTACPIISGVPYYKDTNTTYTLPNATSSTLGGVKIGSNITVSSGTISLTKDNVTAALGYTPPTTNTTYSNMTAATASAAGKAGLVPAPAAGKQASFLRGDGTWVVPTNTTYSNMTAATSSAAGKAGLVPAPAAGKQASFLRGDGTWVVPTNTTYSAATTSAAGLMSAADKSKLDGIASGANAYSLPTASSSTLGGIKVGTNLSISNGVLSATNTTYSAATTSANGLMSSSDKTKLNGIATGAQVNNVVVATSAPTASTAQVWINPNGQSALDAVSVIGEYAEFRLTSHQSVSQSASWGDIYVPFDKAGSFTASNSSMFEASGRGIKCKFNGRVIVLANIGTSQTGKEVDLEIYNSNGSPSERNVINISQGTVSSGYVFNVNNGAVISAGFNSNSLSFTIYSSSTLTVVRIK